MSEVREHIKLSELTNKIKGVIDTVFAKETFWIVAEISSHKMYMNGDRHYFEFVEKDDDSASEKAKVRGIAWREGSESIKQFVYATGQDFKDGIEILSRVKIEYTGKYGLSLILLEIDQSWTLGNLEKQRQATLYRLLKENPDAIQLVGDTYITTNKKLNLKSVIHKIAVIGSPNSAGFKDFEGIISSNHHGYKFSINVFQSSVQGAEAHNELVNRLVSIYNSGVKYDCVVLIRGGGAKTDFLVFDNYLLSKAVARFPIPIITGIGHLQDVSIVDMMAKVHTNTPTKAAEFIIARNRSFEEEILKFQNGITIKSQALLSALTSRINSTNLLVINKSRLILSKNKDLLNKYSNQLGTKPKIIASYHLQDLDNLIKNLKSFSSKLFLNKKGYVGHYQSMIKMATPESILNRGFAIIKLNGRPVKDAEGISRSDTISVVMKNHDLETRVINKTKRKDGTTYL